MARTVCRPRADGAPLLSFLHVRPAPPRWCVDLHLGFVATIFFGSRERGFGFGGFGGSGLWLEDFFDGSMATSRSGFLECGRALRVLVWAVQGRLARRVELPVPSASNTRALDLAAVFGISDADADFFFMQQFLVLANSMPGLSLN